MPTPGVQQGQVQVRVCTVCVSFRTHVHCTSNARTCLLVLLVQQGTGAGSICSCLPNNYDAGSRLLRSSLLVFRTAPRCSNIKVSRGVGNGWRTGRPAVPTLQQLCCVTLSFATSSPCQLSCLPMRQCTHNARPGVLPAMAMRLRVSSSMYSWCHLACVITFCLEMWGKLSAATSTAWV